MNLCQMLKKIARKLARSKHPHFKLLGVLKTDRSVLICEIFDKFNRQHTPQYFNASEDVVRDCSNMDGGINVYNR